MSSSIHAEPPPPIVTEPASGISYSTSRALGKGGFAICYQAERHDGAKPTGQIVALKIVKTKMEPAKLAQKFVTELQIHSKLSHPNIVTFYRAFSFQASTYVVLELCPNGSLADMLKKRKHITLPEIRRLVIQVCGAVKYLHHRHIVHRDLKTGNLFLDHNMDVKVGDFGLAALLVTEKEMEVRRRTTMCGTPNYLAPEILEKGKGHNEKVDLWAIGVIAYTLAVGKAPFHASTKEEIYKKLKSGTYAWPELNSTSNQSADLRDLVSSLLVPEDERPSPDKIVSQRFFTLGYVPESIPDSARYTAPNWPPASIPTMDVTRRGYTDTWHTLCKQSGVGEYSEGRFFPLNGGRKIRSIVSDMQQEVLQGRQPSMPLPEDQVYISVISDFDSERSVSPPNEKIKQDSSASRQLKEISHNEVAQSRVKTNRDAELMPPPRALTRPARSGTVRKAARTISEEAARSAEAVKVASDASAEPGTSATLRVTKTRPAHIPSISAPATYTVSTALKDTNSSSTSAYRTAQTQQASDGSDGILDKPQRAGTTKRAADASLARRPRGNRVAKERPVSPIETNPSVAPTYTAPGRTVRGTRPLPYDAPGPLATLDELKDALPTYRKKTSPADVIEILSDPEPEEKNASRSTDPAALKLSRPPQMTGRLPVPQRKVSSDLDPTITGSDPSTVLEKLATLRDNLASALAKASSTKRQTSAASSNRAVETATHLPFVSRWVDYSRKHGVGYVLADGTVGCIINATAKADQPTTPVAYVLVRNGQKWLQKVGRNKNFAGIEQVPLEYFEDRDSEGVKRKVYKGIGSVKEGPLLAEAERRRTLSVLWVKFGRYMCQALEGEELESNSHDAENFVRFYQRIGSVGIWAFADGCLQVHFPDHTKLVLSADGKVVSATVLTVEATTHLSSKGDLLPQHVNSRQVLPDSVHSLLHEGTRVRQRIVRANQLTEKLTFILEVVSQWVANSGLGHLDEDLDEVEKLCWDGLAVKDQNSRKAEKVTVGRHGGDLRPAERAVATALV